MSKAKISITTLAVVGALGALASASASAATAGWMVNGTLLSGTKALATTAKIDQDLVLKSTAANIELECTGGALAEGTPEIKSPNAGAASSLQFTSCKALTPDCTLSSSTVGTVPVAFEATLESTAAVVGTFKPKTKTLLATFEFGGEKCVAEGINGVTGTAKVLAPNGQQEGTVELNRSIVTEASGELKVASSAAEVKGSALVKLASDEPWSFL
jgi:hypothetical protein